MTHRNFGMRVFIAALAWMGAVLAGPALADTLKDIKARGTLACGVSQGILGFSNEQPAGTWSGFDVDFCRAVATAVLGDPAKVRFVPLSAAERFQALKSGQVDLLARNSTWTYGREADDGVLFVAVTYYDGQGFLVPKSSGASSAMELNGAKVCVQAGTTSVANVVDFFSANGMTQQVVEVNSPAEARAAYEGGRCTAISSDMSQLYAERLKLAKPSDHAVLADVISKEPLSLAVRQDDAQWAALVKWVAFAMIDAEELGVGQANLAEAKTSKRPEIVRLLGTDAAAAGTHFGLEADWAARVIAAVGNYGEVYERNIGVHSPLGIPRGLNQLWSAGGILYAPPIR